MCTRRKWLPSTDSAKSAHKKKRKEYGSNWRSSSHHLKKIPQAVRNPKDSTVEEPIIHLSIWIRNYVVMNEEDDEVEGSRRSLPTKKIKISIQLSFHDIVFVMHLFIFSCYHFLFSYYESSFFLCILFWEFAEGNHFLQAHIPWMNESHDPGRPFKVVITISYSSSIASS